MPEVTNDLIYEVLKQLQIGQAEIKADLRDTKSRLASIEGYIATLHTDTARQSIRVDQLELRLERMESRLNLRDA